MAPTDIFQWRTADRPTRCAALHSKAGTMGRLKAMAPRLSSAPVKLRAAPKEAEPFYRSAAWRGLVSDRKLDADYFRAKARARPGERLILDHKIERKDGGSDLDPDNTEWLTMSEHAVKTARARARRAQGGG